MKIREISRFPLETWSKRDRARGNSSVVVRKADRDPRGEPGAPTMPKDESESRKAMAKDYRERFNVVIARAQAEADRGDWTGAQVLIKEAERLQYWYRMLEGR